MKLLLAEDERELSDVLTSILIDNQYTVDAVYDGESALEYGLKNRYDGMIMDVMMPKKNGFEALAALREHGIETPLLILSAKSEVLDRVKGLELGANDYLPKPFSTVELLARIRAMTRKPIDQTREISLGNVTLDKGASAMLCEKTSIHLSGKEFKMMEMLMLTPAIGISTKRFIDEIWKNDSDTESNVIWLYASYLQKKLSAIGSNLSIKTMQNEGALLLNEIAFKAEQ